MSAVEQGKVNAAKALIKGGADKSIKDDLGLVAADYIYAKGTTQNQNDMADALGVKYEPSNVERELFDQ